MPKIVVDQLWPSRMTVALVWACGATPVTPATCCPIAVTSAGLKLGGRDPPPPRRRPPLGSICRMLVPRSEEHTSEIQSLIRISYAVFCLKKKKDKTPKDNTQ